MKQRNRMPLRREIFLSLLAVTALLTCIQAVAPAPATAMIDLGNGCSLDDWGGVVCDEGGGGSGGSTAGGNSGDDSSYWPWEDETGAAAGSDTGGDKVEGANGHDTNAPKTDPSKQPDEAPPVDNPSQSASKPGDSFLESARRWMQRAWWRQECRRVGHGIKQRIRARYGDDAVFDRVVNSGDRGLDHLQGKWEELGCGRP
jgi:hypothetical protein